MIILLIFCSREHLKDKESFATSAKAVLQIMDVTTKAAKRLKDICDSASVGAGQVIKELEDRPMGPVRIMHAVSTAKAKRCRPPIRIYNT